MDNRIGLFSLFVGIASQLWAACGSTERVCPEGYCDPEHLEIAQRLYGDCSGVPFWPACTDFSCVAPGEEETYLAISEDVLLELVGGDRQYRDAHFKLNNVEITTYSDPPERMFRIDYVFINDWVRIREHAVVVRFEPFDEASFRESLVDFGRGFHVNRKYSRPITFSTLEAKIAACHGSVSEVDWCNGLRFDKETGDMMFGGTVGTIDFQANRCALLIVDLETGQSSCEETVCWVT